MTALTEDEKQAAKARQHKRYRDEAAAKQYSEREHVRSEIPTHRLMGDVITISDILQQGYEEKTSPAGEVTRTELDATRQNGLYKAAEIKFKLISKTVPDLKQIELRADVTEEALPQAITYRVIRPGMIDDILEGEIDE